MPPDRPHCTPYQVDLCTGKAFGKHRFAHNKTGSPRQPLNRPGAQATRGFVKTPTERSLEKRETCTFHSQDYGVPLSARLPGHRIPRLAPGSARGHTACFHERVKGTKRPPSLPAPHSCPATLTGHLSAHKPIPRGHAPPHQPPGPRPQVPLQTESFRRRGPIVRVRRAGRAELKDGLLEASGRPWLWKARAAVPSGDTERRPRTPGQPDAAPGPGESSRARPDLAGLGSGQAGAATDASPGRRLQQPPRSPRAPPPPRPGRGPAPPAVDCGQPQGHPPGRTPGAPPTRCSLGPPGAARCVDRDGRAPPRRSRGTVAPRV
ncbi:basic salivary proline-rich protein 1-like [Equus caballus]|uniref:basic salivary proline-rich protein 1-like n=1 Tax=Equus caballus TaxID=9796 RepID=UPI0038B2C88C